MIWKAMCCSTLGFLASSRTTVGAGIHGQYIDLSVQKVVRPELLFHASKPAWKPRCEPPGRMKCERTEKRLTVGL